MVVMPSSILVLASLFSACILAKPNPLGRHKRLATPENTVLINDAESYCLVVPKDANTDVGDSEYPGGTAVYCSLAGRSSDSQGLLSSNFWTNVEYTKGFGSGRYVQLTGCIDPYTLDRIDPDDSGGQYDSSGGPDGKGNPAGSVCAGFKHYVELLEPAGPRACIRCCDDPDDCPTDQDMLGCPDVIPGNYFDCE